MAFRFLDFEVDPTLYRLTRAGENLAIERRVFDLILYLIQNRDRVVPREELIREVWHGIAVTDHVLAQALHTARKHLEDSATQPKILKTVRGRGVQFVATTTSNAARERRSVPLVGREREIASIENCMRRTESGQPSLLLVSGEGGIGKTRLAEEISDLAEARGWNVSVGRCSESYGAVAFQVWSQLLDETRLQMSLDQWEEACSRFDDFRLLRGMPGPLDWPTGGSLPDAASRLSTFQAIWSFWKEYSAAKPIVLVLEDVHRADESSIQFLKFVAEQMGRGRILIVCTLRELEFKSRAGGSGTHGFLVGISTEQIAVRPLEVEDGADLARRIGSTLDVENLQRLYDRSGGNPLFWHRLHGSWSAIQGSNDLLPGSVRDTVARDVLTLGEECRAIVEVASVVGREFSVSLLAEVAGESPRKIIHELVAAEAVGIVRPRGDSSDDMEFVHSLVRDAVYEGLTQSQRSLGHERVALAWPKDQTLESLSARAHHFLSGMPVVGAATAVRHVVAAGWAAVGKLAFEEALPLLETARKLSQRCEVDPEIKCRMLLGLGEGCLRLGDRRRAERFFRDSAALAEANGLAGLLSQVALRATPGILAIDIVERDELTESLLRRAYSLAPRAREKAMLAARLAMVDYWKHDTGEERKALVREAMSYASRSADPATKGLISAYSMGSLWQAENLGERHSQSHEIIELGRAAENQELEALGHIFLITCLQEMGLGSAFEDQVSRLAEVVQGGGAGPQASWYLPMYRASIALNKGRFSDSLKLIKEFVRIGKRLGGTNIEFCFSGLVSVINYMRQSLDGAIDEIDGMILRYPNFWPWRSARLVLLAADRESRRTASAELEFVSRGFLRTKDQQIFRLATATQLADVAADLGDTQVCTRLISELEPFAERLVTFGYGVIAWGPVARSLGRLHVETGDVDGGIRLLERSIALSRRAGLQTWGSIGSADLVAALRGRGSDGDVEKAEQMSGELRAVARAFGLKEAVRRLDREPFRG